MSPVSGIPSRAADTAKPLMKPSSNPASSMRRADIASWHPGITSRPGRSRSARRRAAGVMSPSADLGRLEENVNPVDRLGAADDHAGVQVYALRDLLKLLVHRDVVAALGEDVDQHRDGKRLVEDRILGVDVGASRDRV